MFNPEVNEALGRFSAELAEKFPEIGEILRQVKSGDIDQVEAMRRLMAFTTQNDAFGDIEHLAGASLSTVAPTTEVATVVKGPSAPSLMENEAGLPKMNPLLEAAIAERIQFDDDVPEARTGPITPGVAPAVPVETSARNLAAVGEQLRQASEAVQRDLEAQSQEFEAKIEGLLADARETTSDDTALMEMVREKGLAIPTGVEGYEAGKVPALRKVEEPTGSALAAMPVEEQQASAYKALSTTQGRRSALAVLEELVLVGLQSDGFEMKARPVSRTADVPVFAKWSVNLSGARSTQSNFNFIDTAARALCRQLTDKLQTVEVKDPVLEVFAIDTVDVRVVGWGARVVSK